MFWNNNIFSVVSAAAALIKQQQTKAEYDSRLNLSYNLDQLSLWNWIKKKKILGPKNVFFLSLSPKTSKLKLRSHS